MPLNWRHGKRQLITNNDSLVFSLSELNWKSAWFWELTHHVGRRLRRHGLYGRTVQLKLRVSDFRTITRAHSLSQPTDATEEISRTALELLRAALPKGSLAIRLLGVGVTGLEKAGEIRRTLFADPSHDRQRKVDAVSDQIQQQFGTTALSRASGLLHQARHKSLARPSDGESSQSE